MLAFVPNAYPSAHNQLSANELEGLGYGQSSSGKGLFQKASIFGAAEPYKQVIPDESCCCISQMPWIVVVQETVRRASNWSSGRCVCPWQGG